MGFMGPGYICNHLVVTRIYWLLLACCPANLHWPLDQSPQSFCSLIQAIEMTGKLESLINLSRSEEIPGARYSICISIAYTEHRIDIILIVTSENRFLRELFYMMLTRDTAGHSESQSECILKAPNPRKPLHLALVFVCFRKVFNLNFEGSHLPQKPWRSPTSYQISIDILSIDIYCFQVARGSWGS